MSYIASIETDAGTYRHGFHLGSDENVARKFCAEFFHNHSPKQGTCIKTVALISPEGLIVDCYDGAWNSETEWPDDDDYSNRDEAGNWIGNVRNENGWTP